MALAELIAEAIETRVNSSTGTDDPDSPNNHSSTNNPKLHIDPAKLQELERDFEILYAPHYKQFLAEELPDLVAVINSSLPPRVKSHIILNYVVDKRFHGKTTLPPDYEKGCCGRYTWADEDDVQRFMQYSAVLEVITSLNSERDASAIARQLTELNSAKISYQALHAFAIILRIDSPEDDSLFENILQHADFMKELDRELQSERNNPAYYEDKGKFDLAKLTLKVFEADKRAKAAKGDKSNCDGRHSAGMLSPDHIVQPQVFRYMIERKYHLSKEESARLHDVYNMPEINRLLGLRIVDETERAMIADLIRSDMGIAPIPKNFPLNHLFYNLPITSAERNLDARAIVFHLVTALTTDSPERFQESSRYFAPDTLATARGYVQSRGAECDVYSSVGRIGFYRRIKQFFEPLRDSLMSGAELSEQDIKNALDIVAVLYSSYITSSEDEGDEALESLVIEASDIVLRNMKLSSIEFHMQGGGADDVHGNITMSSCAFKNGRKNSIGGVLYAHEPDIGLLNITPFVASDTGSAPRALFPIGAAIMVNCVDEEGKKYLVLDTFEGGRGLCLVKQQIWKAYLLQSIYELGKQQEASYVLVNTHLVNPNIKPKEFVHYVNGAGLEERTVNLKMEHSPRIRQYGHEKHLLDIFSKDGKSVFNPVDEFVPVTGRMIDLSQKYDFLGKDNLELIKKV